MMNRYLDQEVSTLLKRVERNQQRTQCINYDQQASVQNMERNG